MNMENIKNDKEFRKFVKKKNLSSRSLENYSISIYHLCNAIEKPFNEIIKEIHQEQYDYIENNRIIKYDPDYGKIGEYQDQFVEYLKNKNNKNTSINIQLNNLRTVLLFFNIQLPTLIELENDAGEWYLLSKEEIKFILSTSNIHYQALITFLASTGLRITDAMSFSINDFMNATKEYHNCTEIKEFLDNAPKNMIAYWDFYPHKTKKHKIRCKVCNTPETSNLILLSLREREKYIERKNKQNNTNYKLEKKDALFASRNKLYKGFVSPKSISSNFHEKNKKLVKERTRILKVKLKSNEISEETFNQLMREIPNFHAHALRKFFISTVGSHVGNLRVCSLMEGHKPPMGLDKNYVSLDDNLIKEAYFQIIPYLSFDNVEVNFLTSKQKVELEEKMDILEKENHKMKENIKSEAAKAVESAMADFWVNR